MPSSRFVFDASRENFNQLVLGNSDKGPVLVYFWTPTAGPCMMLMPRLVQLAAEYGGKFLLVLVNTDGPGQIAPSVRRDQRAHGEIFSKRQSGAKCAVLTALHSAAIPGIETSDVFADASRSNACS